MLPDPLPESDTPGGATVCLLVINRIPRLPKAAVTSILYRSAARVVVGYLDPLHIADIPPHDRVEFIDLSDHVIDGRQVDTAGEYQEFGTGAFSSSVVLKWRLIEHCLTHGPPDIVVYSDVDVIWLEDAAHDLTAAFAIDQAVQVLVQSQQVSAAVRLPCMGFVAFRRSPQALEIVRECDRRNRELFVTAPHDVFISDEDALADVWREAPPGEIASLPQAAYPVGALANLYRREPLLRGLDAPRPIVFHANFVIGVDAKVELLERVLGELGRMERYLALSEN